MKNRLLFPCAAFAGLLLAACDQQPAAPAPPPSPAGPAAGVPSGPSEMEEKLTAQIRDLEKREADLQLQIEQERLAATEAEIAQQKALLEKDREAWRLEQELAEAKKPAASDKAEDIPEDDYQPVAAGHTAPKGTPSFDYQLFYDDLEPLGEWFETEDYGYVWQPAAYVSDNSWRPYTKGRWASTDQGWTWCSDEPFGWACYHYGRWAQIRGRGWVWVPGDQWAPAWVAWRNNDDFIGWCPLPPETVYDHDRTYGNTIDQDCGIDPGSYVFMPAARFDDPVYDYCEPPARCLTILSATINITTIIIRPGRVECPGPRYDWVKERVRRAIPRYQLDCEFDRPERGNRRPRIEDKRLLCYTPGVRAPWNEELRPVRPAPRLRQAEVVRNDRGAPGNLMERFRKLREERLEAARELKNGPARRIMERQTHLATLEGERVDMRRRSERIAAAAEGREREPGPAGDRDRNPRNRDGISRRDGNDDRRPEGRDGQNAGETARRNGGDGRPQTGDERRDRSARENGREDQRLASVRDEIARLRAQREIVAPKTPPAPGALNPPAAGTGNGGAEVAQGSDEALTPQEAAIRRQREQAAAAGPAWQRRPGLTTGDPSTGESRAVEPPRADPGNQGRRQPGNTGAGGRAVQSGSTPPSTGTGPANRREDPQRQGGRPASDERRRQAAAAEEQRKQQAAAAQGKAEAERQAQQNAERQQEQAEAAARQNQQNRERNAAEQQRRQRQQADQQQRETQRQAAEQENRERNAAEQLRRQRQQADQQQRETQRQAAEQENRERNAAEQQRRQQQQADQQQRETQRQAAEQENRERNAAEQQRRQQQQQNEQQQRRQMEEQQRRAQQQAEEQQRRQAEEQQRRAQQQAEQQQRRQAEEQQRRAQQQAEEQQRRQAEEQQRRAQQQAEEQQRRQAEEQQRRGQQQAEEQQRRQEAQEQRRNR